MRREFFLVCFLMILLLGGSGYVGDRYARYLEKLGIAFRCVSRSQCDYTVESELETLILQTHPEFLINCAGYTGKPNVDACELHKTDCLAGNAVLPGIIRRVCERVGLPWGHVSSGCIYTGSREDGSGFREDDLPNFSFRTNNCSFYSGTKALGEEILDGTEACFVWRLRIPFNEVDSPRNYLTKVMRYERLLEARNSLSQVDEFVSATFDCWQKRVPFGIYNVTNPGSVTTREVVSMIEKSGVCNKAFSFFEDEASFMKTAAKTPRSNCVLDSAKLQAAGIVMSPVQDAIEKALKSWSV